MNNNHGIQKRFQRALQITIRNKCANAWATQQFTIANDSEGSSITPDRKWTRQLLFPEHPHRQKSGKKQLECIVYATKVISTVHQLAAACKKYKGITFTDKEGNIIKDDDDIKDDNPANVEITVVDGDKIKMKPDNTGVLPNITEKPIPASTHYEIAFSLPHNNNGNSPKDMGNTIDDISPKDGAIQLMTKTAIHTKDMAI